MSGASAPVTSTDTWPGAHDGTCFRRTWDDPHPVDGPPAPPTERLPAETPAGSDNAITAFTSDTCGRPTAFVPRPPCTREPEMGTGVTSDISTAHTKERL